MVAGLRKRRSCEKTSILLRRKLRALARGVSFCLVALMLAVKIYAITPMDTPLPDGKITLIECEYRKTETKFRDYQDKPRKGMYRYKVYVPQLAV